MNDQTTREQYLPHRKAKELLGISDTTLRRWAKEGRIEFTTTVTGHKRYKVSSAQSKTQKTSRQKVCYCRVSTKKQDQDLDNQVSYLTKQFPEHTIIKDIGSGLNWKRKGLITLLDRVTNGEIQEVVVAHRDRLARFGTELIQYIFDKHQVKLLVLDQEVHSGTEELADDILAIITVFSARYYGKRKYTNKSIEGSKNQIIPKSDTKTKL